MVTHLADFRCWVGEEQRGEQGSGGPGTTSHDATLGSERLVDQRRSSSSPVERFSLAGRGRAALGGRIQQEELVLSINNPPPTPRTTVNLHHDKPLGREGGARREGGGASAQVQHVPPAGGL